MTSRANQQIIYLFIYLFVYLFIFIYLFKCYFRVVSSKFFPYRRLASSQKVLQNKLS